MDTRKNSHRSEKVATTISRSDRILLARIEVQPDALSREYSVKRLKEQISALLP